MRQPLFPIAFDVQVAETLRALRAASGMSQNQLAATIDVGPQSVYNYERCRHGIEAAGASWRRPPLWNIVLMAEALDSSPGIFCGGPRTNWQRGQLRNQADLRALTGRRLRDTLTQAGWSVADLTAALNEEGNGRYKQDRVLTYVKGRIPPHLYDVWLMARVLNGEVDWFCSDED